MDWTILSPWRDAALILLTLQVIVIVAVPGVILYFVLKGVRAVKRWIRSPLLQAKIWARRVQESTTRATNRVATVPIDLVSTGTRITVTTRNLVNFLIGR